MKILIFLTFLFISSCDNNQSIKTYSIPKNNTTTIPLKNTNLDINNIFSWDAPNYWVKEGASSMRLASYGIPYDGGVGDLSVTNFGGDAGGILANVNRWRGQLGLSSISVDKLKNETSVFQSNMGEFKMFKIFNQENESSSFLCSIFEIGHSTVFVKLVASYSGINQLENEFKEFCKSFVINDK